MTEQISLSIPFIGSQISLYMECMRQRKIIKNRSRRKASDFQGTLLIRAVGPDPQLQRAILFKSTTVTLLLGLTGPILQATTCSLDLGINSALTQAVSA